MISEIEIVSSLDSSFAIADALGGAFQGVDKACICYPWIDPSFVHFLKSKLRSGAELNVVAKMPTANDNTFRALEKLEATSHQMRWNLNTVLLPHLHGKFSILDDHDILIGSCNGTNYGIFNNVEILVRIQNEPTVTSRCMEIFESLTEHATGYRWEHVKDYHGSSIERRLVDITTRYLKNQPNREARLPLLIKVYEKHGFSHSQAIEGYQKMLSEGIVYSPREGIVRLV